MIADSYAKDWKPEEKHISTCWMLLRFFQSGTSLPFLPPSDRLAGGAIQALQEHNLDGQGIRSPDKMRICWRVIHDHRGQPEP